jgi:hypothetical protein
MGNLFLNDYGGDKTSPGPRDGGWTDLPVLPTCSFCGRWGYDRRLDHKSRMKCELPVRFREGLGVQLPRATRLVVLHQG